MPSLPDLVVLAAVVGLLVHELDAVRRGEWRFSGRTPLSDETAYRAYVALHVPLLVLLLAGLSWPRFRLDGFVIVHAGLHATPSGHPALDVDGWFSRTRIYGSAAAGGLHLVLVLAGRPPGERSDQRRLIRAAAPSPRASGP